MFSSSLSRSILRPTMKQLNFSTHVKEIKKIGVVGLGLMGHGVAQVSAMAGYEVVGIESNDAALTAGITRIQDSLGKVIAKDVKKGKMTEVPTALPYIIFALILHDAMSFFFTHHTTDKLYKKALV